MKSYNFFKYNSKNSKKTRKNKKGSCMSWGGGEGGSHYKTGARFEKEVTLKFLEMIMMIKLYHWKTFSYATHKATDDLYSKINENMDQFIEILLGKMGRKRTDLTHTKCLRIMDFTSLEPFKREIIRFKSYLVGLNQHPFMKEMTNSDLLNIRDEILGNLNQFLYLLTLDH